MLPPQLCLTPSGATRSPKRLLVRLPLPRGRCSPTYPSVLLVQTVQALGLALLPNIGLVEDEVLATALLCQQAGVLAAPRLWG